MDSLSKFTKSLTNLAKTAPPLVLVFDLDETLIHVDEDGNDDRLGCTCYYRREIFSVLSFIREIFLERLFLVLWSTGDDDYVKHVLFILGLSDFDVVLTRSDSELSAERYGACKSPSYIVEKISKYEQWQNNVALSTSPKIPVWAIIDDKARQNTDIEQPYHFTFSPVELSDRTIETPTMLARTVSLFSYIDTLIFHILFRSDTFFSLNVIESQNEKENNNYNANENDNIYSNNYDVNEHSNYSTNLECKRKQVPVSRYSSYFFINPL